MGMSGKAKNLHIELELLSLCIFCRDCILCKLAPASANIDLEGGNCGFHFAVGRDFARSVQATQVGSGGFPRRGTIIEAINTIAGERSLSAIPPTSGYTHNGTNNPVT